MQPGASGQNKRAVQHFERYFTPCVLYTPTLYELASGLEAQPIAILRQCFRKNKDVALGT